MELDRIDVQILNLVQQNAGLPLHDIAKKVHASVATCQRRLAQLKANGVIQREVAILDRKLVGRTLTAFVGVELERQNDALLRAFERRMQGESYVMECYEVSGTEDFLLVVCAPSMEAYHAFTRSAFSSSNNVRNFTSTFAMNCAKFETSIALEVPK